MPAFAGMTGGENGGLGYGYLIMWDIPGLDDLSERIV